jgi:hypothetical protein
MISEAPLFSRAITLKTPVSITMRTTNNIRTIHLSLEAAAIRNIGMAALYTVGH